MRIENKYAICKKNIKNNKHDSIIIKLQKSIELALNQVKIYSLSRNDGCNIVIWSLSSIA